MEYSKKSIKTFVRKTLGCICPEEVFEYIEVQPHIKLTERIAVDKINIGNKLLIFLVEENNAVSLKALLPFLVAVGKNERDTSGFSRFRLVVATNRVKRIQNVAEQLFREIDRDERIYLHVVAKDNLPMRSRHAPAKSSKG